jgi:hypothetical protein
MELTKDAMNLFKLLKKHVSHDITRYFMNNVYYDDSINKFIATDGYSMMLVHKSRIADVTESGYYDLDGTRLVKVDNCGQFPDWKRVYPEYKSESYEHHQVSISKNITTLARLNTLLSIKLGIWIDFQRLKKLPVGTHDLYVDSGKVQKSVVFTPCPSVAVIISQMQKPADDEGIIF